MTSRPRLDPRSRAILLETVNHYIVTAEPVSSRLLSKKLSERLSPASVRAVMADLEDRGLLFQPHTSAGRIPTDLGYRFFVDELLRARQDLPGQPDYALPAEDNLSGVLGSACSLLSDASQQTGLVRVPSFDHLPLERIEFLSIHRRQVLAVFISKMGVAQNRVVDTEEDFTPDRLSAISRYLNDEFAGHSLNGLRKSLVERVRTEREHYDQLRRRAADLCARATGEREDHQLLVEGLNHLLDHPELSANVETMKALLKTVEEKSKLVHLLDLCMEREGLSIVIGRENSEIEMQECSLIARNYRIDQNTLGTMAIIGPKRMDYMRMIDLVDRTASHVSDYLSSKTH